MKGTVEIFNTMKGVGFLTGEDGSRYFFHQNELMIPGFRAIVVGREVKFTEATREGRPVAMDINPVNGTGVQVANPLPRAIMLNNGIVVLRVDILNRIYAKENLFPFGEYVIAPGVRVEGAFRAFKTDGIIRELTVRLPQPTSLRAFVALDPNKNVLPPSDQLRLDPGSYILSLEEDGTLDVQSIGRRHQSEKGGGNWVVLEHRFRHTLNLQQDIANQIPTSGLERDNDGFLPGIRQALAMLSQQEELDMDLQPH